MKKYILIMIMILTVFVAPIKVSALETVYNNEFVQIVAKNTLTITIKSYQLQ